MPRFYRCHDDLRAPVLAITSLHFLQVTAMGVVGGDAFHLSAMRGFAIARIAGDHAIFVEEMQVLLARSLLTA